MTNTIIVGCGNIGRRIAKLCLQAGQQVTAISQTESSKQQNAALVLQAYCFDFDQQLTEQTTLLTNIEFANAKLYYLVPPQKQGITDKRSQHFLSWLSANRLPAKIVLVSTTGVYGDCNGVWVTERTLPNPQTERGKRRANAEQQWQNWGKKYNVPVVTLRVPGIYANDRLPRERLEKGIPVVNAEECGYTNRIHAEDLARICIIAMKRIKQGQKAKQSTVYNVTDGTPGKITEYLQAAAEVLGLPPPPVISMQQAQQQLSSGMLSYLSESRRISNRLMLKELKIELLYPDFKKGLLA